ncbi:UvrD-helicase domain-containing protein [uncultured Thiohalocapsa sp.]|uniref:UvrD-helicase domain-containing protein n=1 Tax=uncultured Thiohalocapsa sp. TaxID=768990 RepID=UPI0025DD128F|nr:UvrD-helicase domain-containing protein [uncultured Thiohalocapsa sp.]
MRILTYRGLDTAAIPGIDKLTDRLACDDFKSADVKKVGDNLYRARLDRSNRLLFALYRHQGERCALLLEYIPNHAYEKSRFLARGVDIEEARIPAAAAEAADAAPELPYLNPALPRFHLLDKVLSFDDDQEMIYRQPPPLVIIGSAGSGKTALTLEKMKDAAGDVLYVTRSAFLVQNARNLYYANGWQRDDQDVAFLSFREYLESIQVPVGKEITPRAFAAWAGRQRLPKALKDGHQLFEEFQGAITGADPAQAYLSRDAYLALGVKQSIYPPETRAEVYDLFEKYLRFLDEQGWFDANLVSHAWLSRVTPRYDWVVVDEVQDLTNVQLLLILKALRDANNFLLCGDANQIVHPNFFSWSKVKSLFWRQQADGSGERADLIRILNANFRNSPQVTDIANRLLHIKHARFGSVDRESNYLVRSCGPARGRVGLLQDSERVKRDLDQRTAASARFAILVLHPEQKAEVRKFFRTPLVFSIHEAKGLEYENVLLYGFLSSEEKRFRDIAAELTEADLQGELRYARARDKGDKSLEIYKFYINALYVAVTRAVRNLYLIEPRPRQHLLSLLGLSDVHQSVDDVETETSSLEEWRHEAHRLELQGKEEQAAEIREQILKQRTPTWTVLRGEALAALKEKALTRGEKKAGIALMEYALMYSDQRLLNNLIQAGVKAAKQPDKAMAMLEKKYFLPYTLKNPGAVLREVDQYGVDFRNVFGQTPLMVASRTGNADLIEALLDRDADTALVDANGLNAFQIALERACVDERFARRRLPAVYERLAPPSLDIQVEGRLVKLDQRLMEYLMLCIAMVLFYQRLGENYAYGRGLMSAVDIEEILAQFPESVVPARRKRRQYLSSILAKNEIDRNDPYNRKLFLRWRRGHYIINPQLSLRVEGEWRRIYDVLAPERLGARLRDPLYWGSHSFDPNASAEQALDTLRDHLQALSDGRSLAELFPGSKR